MEDFKPDSIVRAVIDRFISRAKFGNKKYNTDLDRTDLTVEEWCQHSIEEHHDALLYLEKFKGEVSKLNRLIELLLVDGSNRTIEENIELTNLKKWWYEKHS